VKTEELYGYISMATREWRDGLLSKVMRDFGEIQDEKPKWIILDGDLDAVSNTHTHTAQLWYSHSYGR
jgi:dynein heavy chain, axonemal